MKTSTFESHNGGVIDVRTSCGGSSLDRFAHYLVQARPNSEVSSHVVQPVDQTITLSIFNEFPSQAMRGLDLRKVRAHPDSLVTIASNSAHSRYLFDETERWLIHVKRGRVHVEGIEPMETSRQAMRALRDIVYRRAVIAGYSAFHAGAIALKDKNRAILILGPSNSGKTTLICALLMTGDCLFIGNDRALVHPKNGHCFCLPMPVRLNPMTLAQLPEISTPGLTWSRSGENTESLSLKGNLLPARNEKAELTPRELSYLLSAERKTTSIVAGAIMPNFNLYHLGPPVLIKLAPVDALKQFQCELIPTTDPIFPEAWAGDSRDTRLNERRSFMYEYLLRQTYELRYGPSWANETQTFREVVQKVVGA